MRAADPGRSSTGSAGAIRDAALNAAKDSEPEAVAEALALIGAIYRHEKQIRDDTLTGAAKREYRTVHIRPVVGKRWRRTTLTSV